MHTQVNGETGRTVQSEAWRQLHRVIGNGKVGPITQKFTKTFREMVAQNAPED